MKYFILVFFLMNSGAASGELVTPKRVIRFQPAPLNVPNQASLELNGCKPTLDAGGAKYSEVVPARKAAEANDLSKEEILARLIYAESLSTGFWNGLCQAPSDTAIMDGIGWGILKRVKAKKKTALDPYSDVIFAKAQFATSFSSMKQNPFAEAFLCPLKADTYLSKAKVKTSATELYKKSRLLAEKLVATFEAEGLPEKYKGVTNFFYPRSEHFGEMRPSWAPDKDPTKNKGYLNLLEVPANPCIEFYKL